jgi:hypothetical protein
MLINLHYPRKQCTTHNYILKFNKFRIQQKPLIKSLSRHVTNSMDIKYSYVSSKVQKKFLGFHDGGYQECHLMVCYAVWLL